jgi:hypothetical protein
MYYFIPSKTVLALLIGTTLFGASYCSSVMSEELSFEEWESSLESNIGESKSNIEDFPLTPITGEELSNTAINDALPVRSTANGKPAFKVMNDKENQSKEGLSQDILLKQETDTDFAQSPFVPQEINFQQDIYAAPDGRELQHNNQAFERP